MITGEEYLLAQLAEEQQAHGDGITCAVCGEDSIFPHVFFDGEKWICRCVMEKLQTVAGSRA